MNDYYSQKLKDIENGYNLYKDKVDLNRTIIEQLKKDIKNHEQDMEINLGYMVRFKSEKRKIENELGKIDKLKETNTFLDKFFRKIAAKFT